MIAALTESPLLLLFTVIAIGYGLGELRLGSFKLGVAAVLFVGLGFGALDPALEVPQFIVFLGLAIFVYTVGLSSAPAFFASFRRHGFSDVYFAIGTVVLSAVLAYFIGQWLDFDAATHILDRLQEAGLIGPYVGGHRRDILMSADEWQEKRVGSS